MRLPELPKMKQRDFTYSNRVVVIPMLLVLSIWSVYMLELRLGVNLNSWGIYPRSPKGLTGIIASPFIHGSVRHLYNNSIPLAVLTAALFYFYRQVAWKTLLLGSLLTGVLTWLIGRPSYHIGASGLIYLMASFIFFKGVLSRHYRLVALSLIVVFVYGGMLWYVFPIKEGISWEGHLSGALAGVVLAFALRTELPPKQKYAWESPDYREEEDPFMRHFDADGNFIENSMEPQGDESPSSDPSGGPRDQKGIRFRYEYREKPQAPEDPDA